MSNIKGKEFETRFGKSVSAVVSKFGGLSKYYTGLIMVLEDRFNSEGYHKNVPIVSLRLVEEWC